MTVEAHLPEGQIAAALAQIQKEHAAVSLGSYPFYRDAGPGTQLVVRGRDKKAVENAAESVEAAVREEGVQPLRVAVS